MTSIWVESLVRSFGEALDLMAGAVSDCPEELWSAPMWTVPAPEPSAEVRGSNMNAITDVAARHALVQRQSTPWGIAWHALERLDYLLTGGSDPWEVWPPLSRLLATGAVAAQPAAPGVLGHTGLDILTMSTPWSRAEVLEYVAYCRQCVRDTLIGLTDQKAAAPAGRKTFAARLLQAQSHVIEHATQIRQFVTTAPV